MAFINVLVGGNLSQFLLEVVVIVISFVLIFIDKFDFQANHNKPGQTAILKIIGIYALFGSLWIYLSDQIVAMFFQDPITITGISLIKGTLFIILTTFLLYFVLGKYLKKYHLSQKELLTSESRFRFLVEQAPEAILIYSVTQDRFVDANTQAEKLFGLARDQINILNFQKTCSLSPLNPVSDLEVKDHIQKALIGETVICERFIHNSTTGEDIPCEIRMVQLPSTEDQLIRLSFIDISERHKTQARIIELNELKNNFIKIISHQLRTPLTIIRWSLDAILSGENGHLSKGQDDIIRVAAKADDEVISRLNDLLTVMDIEEKRVLISKEQVQLESLLKSVINNLKAEIKVKKIKFQVIIPKKNLPLVMIDSLHLREVFVKFIDNAITYTPEKGKIIVKLFLEDHNIRFEVIDNGIGIPIKEQPLLFNYFHRASNAYIMKQDASGVSLNIAKHFIEAHDGQIGFTSIEGKGSTFWFTLPILESSQVQLNA